MKKLFFLMIALGVLMNDARSEEAPGYVEIRFKNPLSAPVSGNIRLIGNIILEVDKSFTAPAFGEVGVTFIRDFDLGLMTDWWYGTFMVSGVTWITNPSGTSCNVNRHALSRWTQFDGPIVVTMTVDKNTGDPEGMEIKVPPGLQSTIGGRCYVGLTNK